MPNRLVVALAGLALSVTAVSRPAAAQNQQYADGQNVVPVFEGWERNTDGTFNLLFGYLNRNYEEEIDVPIGPNNTIDSGSSGDASQPTHFYPRRNRFIFRVKVPKDFGKKEVVWTLTVRGKTEKAYGHLLPEEEVGDQVIAENRHGAGYAADNRAPTIQVVGPDKLTATAGQPLSLVVLASDDGIPKRGPAANSRPPGRFAALGLRVNWFIYRGPENAKVTFDPWIAPGADHVPGWTPPPMPPDGRVTTTARFSAPGTYILRAIADDGYLYTPVHLTVTVTGPGGATTP